MYLPEKMRQYLSIEAFKKLEKVMIEGGTIDRGLADQVAAAMESLGCRKGSKPITPIGFNPERSYGRKTRWVYRFAKTEV